MLVHLCLLCVERIFRKIGKGIACQSKAKSGIANASFICVYSAHATDQLNLVRSIGFWDVIFVRKILERIHINSFSYHEELVGMACKRLTCAVCLLRLATATHFAFGASWMAIIIWNHDNNNGPKSLFVAYPAKTLFNLHCNLIGHPAWFCYQVFCVHFLHLWYLSRNFGCG